MVFSSPTFLFWFLLAVLWGRLLIGQRIAWQNILLLVASFFFYASADAANLALLTASIIINYGVGLFLGPKRPRLSRIMLAVGVTANLLLLGSFKYAGYVVAQINGVVGHVVVTLDPIPLPLGISFFTFQAMSYLIDVARGDSEPQRNLFRLAMYISLFPQLVAGPIVRYRHVDAQIAERKLILADLASGMRRFIVGLGKKILIADNLAPVVQAAFDSGLGAPGPMLAWLGALCFTGQIYFDFSGYSDMAIGLGRMFGFHFRENFEHPYASRSIVEFWRRWHISLSTWFRDYLYIPLGGNRCPPLRRSLNLWIVFVLCGLWHGASTSFLVWGIYHGTFLVLERTRLDRLRAKLPGWAAQIYTLAVVVIGWVLFRANTLNEALVHLASMSRLFQQPWSGETGILATLASEVDAVVALALIASVIFATRQPTELLARNFKRPQLDRVAPFARDSALIFCFFACIVSAAATTFRPFLYWRF